MEITLRVKSDKKPLGNLELLQENVLDKSKWVYDFHSSRDAPCLCGKSGLARECEWAKQGMRTIHRHILGMEKELEGQSPRPSNGHSSSLSMPEGTASLSVAYKLFTGLPSSPSHLGRSDSVPNVLVTVLCPNPGRDSILGSESPATKGLWLLLNASNRCSLPKAFDQADSPRWATGCSSYIFSSSTRSKILPNSKRKKNPPLSLTMGLQEGWFSFHIYLLSAVENTVLKQ